MNLTAKIIDPKDVLSPLFVWLTDLVQLAPFPVLKAYVESLLFNQPNRGDPLYDSKEMWDMRADHLMNIWAEENQQSSSILTSITAILFDHLSKMHDVSTASNAFRGYVERWPVVKSAILHFFTSSNPDAVHHETLKRLASDLPWSPSSALFELHPLIQVLYKLKLNSDSHELRLHKDWFILYFTPVLVDEAVEAVNNPGISLSPFTHHFWNYLISDQCKHWGNLVPSCDGVYIDGQGPPQIYSTEGQQKLLIPLSCVLRLFQILEQQLQAAQRLLLDTIIPILKESTFNDPTTTKFPLLLQDLVDVYTVCKSPYILNSLSILFEFALEQCTRYEDKDVLKVVQGFVRCLFEPTSMDPIGINISVLDSSEESSTDYLLPFLLRQLNNLAKSPPFLASLGDSNTDTVRSYQENYVRAVVREIEDVMWSMAGVIEAARHAPYRCPNPATSKSISSRLDSKAYSDDPFLARVGAGGSVPTSTANITTTAITASPSTTLPPAVNPSQGTYRRSDIVASRTAAGLERSILLLLQFLQQNYMDDREEPGSHNGSPQPHHHHHLIDMFIVELAKSRLLLDVLMTAVSKKMSYFDTVSPTTQLLKLMWDISTRKDPLTKRQKCLHQLIKFGRVLISILLPADSILYNILKTYLLLGKN